MPSNDIPTWQPGESEGYALPCQCGPGVRNRTDTDGPIDYECPSCGATFTSDEVDDGE